LESTPPWGRKISVNVIGGKQYERGEEKTWGNVKKKKKDQCNRKKGVKKSRQKRRKCKVKG
jgi:hypothetical protein